MKMSDSLSSSDTTSRQSFNFKRSTIFKRNQKRVAKLRARPKDHRIAPVRILANLPAPIGPIFALNDDTQLSKNSSPHQVETSNGHYHQTSNNLGDASSSFDFANGSDTTIIEGLSLNSRYASHHCQNHQHEQSTTSNEPPSAKFFIQASIGGGFGGALEAILGRTKNDVLHRTWEQLSIASSVNQNQHFNFFTEPMAVNVEANGTKGLSATGVKQLEHNSFLSNAGAENANLRSHRLLTSVMSAGILFGSNAYIRKVLGADESAPISDKFFLSSALTGVVTASLFTPFELVRSRQFVSSPMALPFRKPVSTSVVGAYLAEGYQVAKQDGLRALYCGGSYTFPREIIGNVMYFSTYKLARSYLENNEDRLTMSKLVQLRNVAISGALAGVSYWSLVYPIDTLRAMVQARSFGAGGVLPSSSAMGRISVQCLYHGYLPCVVRAMPANAALFIGYEFVMNSLS